MPFIEFEYFYPHTLHFYSNPLVGSSQWIRQLAALICKLAQKLESVASGLGSTQAKHGKPACWPFIMRH